MKTMNYENYKNYEDFSFSKYSNFYNFFLSSPQFQDSQGPMEVK